MKRSIGDIFKCDKVTLEVVLEKEEDSCTGCHWYAKNCMPFRDIRGHCATGRKEGVIFERKHATKD